MTLVDRSEVFVMAETLTRELNALPSVAHFRTCITCCNFNERDEVCTLAQARPPAKVIAYGCEQWDDLPF